MYTPVLPCDTALDPTDDPRLADEFEIGPDQWVSDSGVVTYTLENGSNTVIEADPNTGKSTAALQEGMEYFERTGMPFIFVADTTTLADQLSVPSGLPVYHAATKENDIDTSRPFITIYDHVHRFVNNRTVLFVDEWHSIVTGYSWRDAIDRMVQSFEGFKQIIGLTGTGAFVVQGYRHVRVKQNRPPLGVTLVGYNDLVPAVLREILERPDLVHFVSLFAKGGPVDQLENLLVQAGLDRAAILRYNADTKESAGAQYLIQSSQLPPNVRVVLATYAQGFSIKGRGLGAGFAVHVVPAGVARHAALDIAQVAHRIREGGALRLVNLYHNFKQREKPKSRESYHAELLAEARRHQEYYRKRVNLPDSFDPGC